MEAVGAPGAGFVVALENLFPPIPSEVILPLASFTASRGGFTLLEAIFWTTAGSLLGAYVLYVLGGWLGRDRTRSLIGRIPFVAVDDVDKVERGLAGTATRRSSSAGWCRSSGAWFPFRPASTSGR